jgi:rod shape-determining protein MreD
MVPFFRKLLLGLLVLLLQWLVFGRLRIWGVYPDVLLLYVVIASLREGRLAGSVFGFVLGFGMDFLYDTWGVHMLSKTIVGFLVGLFAIDPRDKLHISPMQALIVALVIALVHNGITVIFYALGAGTRTPFLIFGLWLGSAAYTAFVALLAAMFASRR